MANFKRMRVRLGEIRPSEQNPREDFGDIAALAASIEATGGEPVNPPVLVRDGNVFRIVDGERRYRALKTLHSADEGVDALVLDDYGEADELVAMLATDDKKALTEAERSRGVQQMLVLGVDEVKVEKAARATRGQVRAMKRLGDRLPGGRQLSLEQMEAAAQFEDDSDVEAVLSADDGAWRAAVVRIERKNEHAAQHAAALEWCAAQGIEVVEEAPEGEFGREYKYYRDVPELPEDIAALYVVDSDPWMVFLMEPDDGPKETPEEAAAKAERKRVERNIADLQMRAARFAIGPDLDLSRVWDEVGADARAHRAPANVYPRALSCADKALQALNADLARFTEGFAAGEYEIRRRLVGTVDRALGRYKANPWEASPEGRFKAADRFVSAVELFAAAGLPLTEEDEELRRLAEAERDRYAEGSE